jgi:hypothetical protein
MLNLRNTLAIITVALSFPLFGCAVLLSSGDDKNHRPAQLPQVTASDEMVAKLRLISIAKAELQYQFDADGEYGTLEQLIQKGLLVDPSKGQLARYRFEVTLQPHGFEATAVPEQYGVTGDRSFFIDQTNVIRAADKHGEKATAQDPPA